MGNVRRWSAFSRHNSHRQANNDDSETIAVWFQFGVVKFES